MDLKNTRILLTGASGGIGSAIAVALAAAGAELLLVGRKQPALDALADGIRAGGGRCETLRADIGSAEDRQRLVDHCRASGGIDVLLNNAGTSQFGLLEQQGEAVIEAMIHTNLVAPILLTRALLPQLKQRPEGTILNIGSTFGSIGYPAFAAYCASKFGLRGFTEALRREEADSPLRVLYLAPRATRTALNTDAVNALNDTLGNASDAPETVAAAVVELLTRGRAPVTYLGFPEKLFARINQIIPSAVDGALRKQLATIKRFATRNH